MIRQQIQADFIDLRAEDTADLARLNTVIGGAQYNFFLHSVPHDAKREAHAPSYHWHLEVCPCTSIPTGFGLGSGLFVNIVNPEQAGDRLRAAAL